MQKIARLTLLILARIVVDQDLRFTFGISPLDNLRVFLLKLSGAKIGKNSYIRSKFYITNPSLLQIGNSSGIARNCSLYLYDNLVIGDFVKAGSGLTIHTSEHIIHSNSDLPIVSRGSKSSTVVIHDNVYIGSNVTILSGVNIDSNVVVAAGAVVISSLSSGYVYGGVPAKKLRTLPAQ